MSRARRVSSLRINSMEKQKYMRTVGAKAILANMLLLRATSAMNSRHLMPLILHGVRVRCQNRKSCEYGF
jgi:hypothetical protein